MRKLLQRKRVLITAGPTREYLDPVRYISNDSSGKMGYSLACAARMMGAEVTLISGPTNLNPPKGSKIISVISARQMHSAALSEYKKADIIICTAAVADIRPHKRSAKKINKDRVRSIRLIKNPDILKSLGKKKGKNQVLVGFALETNRLLTNAKDKLKSKNCDFIVANSEKNIGSDSSTAYILDISGKKTPFKNQPKKKLAENILKRIAHNFSGL